MKALILIIGLLVSVFNLQAQTGFTTNGCVTLAWPDSPSATGDTNELYVLHHSTNAALPKVEWETIATLPATNNATLGLSTNQAEIFFPVGVHYFYLTFSNGWGESPPTDIIGTPQAPMPPMSLRILRLRETP